MNRNPNGHDYEYIVIPASEIKIDTSYQRPLDEKRVRKIVNTFNGDIFNEPKVSFRNGSYWCFDGQQSRAAWQLLHNNPDEPITCKVFYGLTWEDEVDLFVLQNGLDADVATNCKLRARYNKGEPDVVEFYNIAASNGYKINWGGSGGLKGNIDAVKSAFDCFNQLGPIGFNDLLYVIRKAYGNDPEAVQGKFLVHIKRFFKLYYPQFDKQRLADVLAKSSPREIVKIHNRDKDMDKNAGLKEIIRLYNKTLSVNRLEYKL